MKCFPLITLTVESFIFGRQRSLRRASGAVRDMRALAKLQENWCIDSEILEI